MVKTRLVALTQDELLTLLKVARADNKRHHGLLLVSALHGLRASEAVILTTENFRDGFLSVSRLKGSNATNQPLLSNSNQLLNERAVIGEILRETAPGALICPSEWQERDSDRPLTRHGLIYLMQKYGQLAGIPAHKHHPHVLKHYCGRRMTDAGVSIDRIQKWLGHRSITSTAAYQQGTDEDAAKATQEVFGSKSNDKRIYARKWKLREPW